MTSRGERSRRVLPGLWLVVGLALLGVVGWLGLTRWESLLNGSPITLVLCFVAVLVGIIATATAASQLWPGRPARPQRRLLTVVSVVLLVLAGLVAVSLAYARPLPASAVAVDATRSSATVRVSDRLTWYELVPTRTDKNGDAVRPTKAVVFAPGAKVDPRAYAPLLRPLAEKGYLVAVLKPPLGLAVVQPGQAQSVLDAHPEIEHWTAAGHSLGGAMITSFADHQPEIGALILWASYGTVTRTDLAVLSVSGSADGVLPPAEVESHKADLPASTRYVVIEGGVHAFFGDYGTQSGDGVATVSRARAQQQIEKATLSFLQTGKAKPR